MIFLCFSSSDRYSIAESIYYHLTNFGLSVWYDRKEILMGNDRNYKNFIEGVGRCEYAIIILSPNSIASVCANEEIDLIYKQYKLGTTYIFPIFYNITAAELPQKYLWMKKLVYKELQTNIDSRGLCNHIACKCLKDDLQQYPFKSIKNICDKLPDYIKLLLSSYQEIDGNNFNARISILYAGILFLNSQKEIPYPYLKGTLFLFNETKLNLPIDLRETIIFELLFLLASNYYLD